MPDAIKKAAKIVISYSHRDEHFRDELTSALSPAIRAGEIEVWSDHRIVPGRHIDDEILSQLKEADAVLLMVSTDFIASDYCFKTELEIALDRHKNARAIVLPVIVRPTDFSGMPFSRLKMLPTDAKAVTTWDNRDEAWLSVAQGVRAAIAELPRSDYKQSVFRSKNIRECLVENFDELQRKYVDQGGALGEQTGYAQLDNLLFSLSEGEVVLIAGRPGTGYTELSLALGNYAAIKYRKRVCVVSQRLSAQRYANRMLCSTGFVAITDLHAGQLEDEDWSRVSSTIRMLKETNFTIDDESVRSLSDLDRKLNIVGRDGCDLLILDGLEYLSAGSRQEQKAMALRFRDFARSHKACVLINFALAHQVDERILKRPHISDLSDWEGIEQSSDKIILVSRPDLYLLNGRDYGQLSALDVEVAKNTDGMLGDVSLKLHTYSGAVSEDDEIRRRFQEATEETG